MSDLLGAKLSEGRVCAVPLEGVAALGALTKLPMLELSVRHPELMFVLMAVAVAAIWRHEQPRSQPLLRLDSEIS